MPALVEEFIQTRRDVGYEVADFLLLLFSHCLLLRVIASRQQEVDLLHRSDEPLVRDLRLVDLGEAFDKVDLHLYKLLLVLPEEPKVGSEKRHLFLSNFCLLDQRMGRPERVGFVLILSLDGVELVSVLQVVDGFKVVVFGQDFTATVQNLDTSQVIGARKIPVGLLYQTDRLHTFAKLAVLAKESVLQQERLLEVRPQEQCSVKALQSLRVVICTQAVVHPERVEHVSVRLIPLQRLKPFRETRFRVTLVQAKLARFMLEK